MEIRKPSTEEAEEAACKHEECSSFLSSLAPDNSMHIEDRKQETPIRAENNGAGFYLKVMKLFKRKK